MDEYYVHIAHDIKIIVKRKNDDAAAKNESLPRKFFLLTMRQKFARVAAISTTTKTKTYSGRPEWWEKGDLVSGSSMTTTTTIYSMFRVQERIKERRNERRKAWVRIKRYNKSEGRASEKMEYTLCYGRISPANEVQRPTRSVKGEKGRGNIWKIPVRR
ncbi:hypothetical protein PGB90_009358 [Kerria lacca]